MKHINYQFLRFQTYFSSFPFKLYPTFAVLLISTLNSISGVTLLCAAPLLIEICRPLQESAARHHKTSNEAIPHEL